MAHWTSHQPGAAAIASQDGTSLSYGDLMHLVDQRASDLASLGVSSLDRVGIVLPDGPRLATSFLAAAHVSAAAPTQPGFDPI